MTDKTNRPSGLTIDVETFRAPGIDTSLFAHLGEYLAQLSEYLPVGVWIINSRGQIIYVNAEAQRIWGGARYLATEDFDRFKGWWLDSGKRLEALEWAAARAVLHGETSRDEEITIETFDGARKIIRNSALPIRTAEGNIVGAIALSEDITTRKHAERRLQVVEDQYRRIVEHSLQGMCLIDPDRKITFVNGVGASMLGYIPEEVLGRPVLEFVSAPHRAKAHQELANRFSGASNSWEFQVTRKDGTLIWVRLFGSPLYDEQGGIYGSQVVFIDITEEKEAEEALADVSRKLKQALYAAHMLVWDWDLATDSFVTSGRISEALEFLVPDVGKSAGKLSSLVHPDDLPGLRAAVARAVQAEHCFVHEFRVVNPSDGTIRWLEAQCVASVDASGETTSLRGVMFDVTARKQAEEKLKESEEHAQLLARQFHVMVDASREKMILVDAGGTIRATSMAGAQELGYTHEELIGRPASELVRRGEYLRLRLMAEDLLHHPGSQVRHLVEVQSEKEPPWWCMVKASVLSVGSSLMFLLTIDRMPGSSTILPPSSALSSTPPPSPS